MADIPIPPVEDDDGGERPVVRYQWVYFLTLLGVALLFWGVGRYYQGSTTTFLWLTWDGGYLIWTAGFIYFLSSIRLVSRQKIAGVFIFEVPTIQVSGQPIIVLWGLMTMPFESKLVIQIEIPDEPERVYHGHEPIVPAGLKPPNRVTFARDPREDVDDPLTERVTAEIPIFVRLRVVDFFTYYERIGSIAEAKRQIEDLSVNRVIELLTPLTAKTALVSLGRISTDLERHVDELTHGWGTELDGARVKLIGFSRDINVSLQSVVEGRSAARVTVIQAEADKTAFIRRGEGEGEAIYQKQLGEGRGLRAKAQSLRVKGGAEVLAAETARSIGESPSTKIVVGLDGIKEMVGVATAAVSALKPKPTAKETE